MGRRTYGAGDDAEGFSVAIGGGPTTAQGFVSTGAARRLTSQQGMGVR